MFTQIAIRTFTVDKVIGFVADVIIFIRQLAWQRKKK